MPRYGRQAAIAAARRKRNAASGAIRVIAVAQANDEVAWAEGKLRELGAPPSGGRPSSTGRGRPTISLTAKLRPIATGPRMPATSQSSPLSGSAKASTIPITTQTAPYSPILPSHFPTVSAVGPWNRVRIAYSRRLSRRASTAAQDRAEAEFRMPPIARHPSAADSERLEEYEESF